MISKMKLTVLLLVICLCMTILAGCSTTNNPDKYTTMPRDYVFAGSTSTGSFYMQSTPIASLWEKMGFVETFTVEATSGSIENYLLIAKGNADVGIADAFTYHTAKAGEDPYKGIEGNGLSICSAAPSQAQFVVRADSDIYSISDLKGCSMATGAVGSGTEFQIRLMLEELGITYADFERVEYLGVGTGLTQLQDNKIDVVAVLAAYPNASITETATNINVRILEFSEEEVATLLENTNWLIEETVPKDTYKGVDKDLRVVAAPEILFVNENIPQEVVYEMTKTVYENWENLKKTNTAYNRWAFNKAVDESVPLHPGAKQYYEEKGLLE